MNKTKCLVFYCVISIFWITKSHAEIVPVESECSVPIYPSDLVVYQNKVSRSEIKSAILNGNWKYALQLISSYTTQYILDPCHYSDVIKILQQASVLINKIVNDKTKTEEQKRTEIEKLIDQSMSKNASSQTGDLKASHRYSLKFGLTRVSFDVSERDDMCSFETGFYYDNGFFRPYYKQTRLTRSPYIKIYRIQDNMPEELVVQFEGAHRTYSKSYSLPNFQEFSDNFWNAIGETVWLARDRFSKEPSNKIVRPTIDLPTGIYLNTTKRLGFKIVALYEGNLAAGRRACSQDISATSFLWIDKDADAKADIVTSTEYDEYFWHLHGSAVSTVIIDLLMND